VKILVTDQSHYYPAIGKQSEHLIKNRDMWWLEHYEKLPVTQHNLKDMIL